MSITSSLDYSNYLINQIVDALDYAETTGDPQGFQKARRLLNNDLRAELQDLVSAGEKATVIPVGVVVGVPSLVYP